MKKLRLLSIFIILVSFLFIAGCEMPANSNANSDVKVGNVVLDEASLLHGKVTLSSSGEVEVGTIINIDIEVDDGFELDYIKVNDRTLFNQSFKVVEGDNFVLVTYNEKEKIKEEKVVNINANNFDKIDFLSLVNVVPNISYPNEFTMTKGTGVISCSAISEITKIVLIVYSNNGAIKVYDGLDSTKELTPTSTIDNPSFTKGKEITYVVDNKNEFMIKNESSSNVYFFELNIYYTGEISGDLPFFDNKDEVEISSKSLNKSKNYNSFDVEKSGDNLSFKPNGYCESISLYKVLNIKMYNGNSDFSVYVKNNSDELLKLTGQLKDDYVLYNVDGLYDKVLIKNETDHNITVTKFVISYEEEKVIHDISIKEAVSIALSLPMSSGLSSDFYRLTGVVILENGNQITLANGEDSIVCYVDNSQIDLIHVGYNVTINGQLENYYYKAEVVNIKIENFEEVYYDLTLSECKNGHYTVNKEKDFKYGEQLIIKAYPDEGYLAKQAKIGGRVYKFNDENVVKASITSNSDVSVFFVIDNGDEPIVLDEKRFVIHSLEMSGTYGDANLIQYGNYDILVDAGTSSDTLNLKKMLSEYVTDGILDLIIVSHPDSDHYSGIVEGSLEGINEVKRLIVNSNHKENDDIKQAVLAKSSDALIQVASEITSSENKIYKIEVDDLFSVDIMYVPAFESGGKNAASIPAIINFRDAKLFMAGDMTASSCEEFMTTYPNYFKEDDFVIFKVLHHGSNGSNKTNFLEYLKPDVAFVNAPLKTSQPNNSPSFSTHPYNEAMIRVGAFTTETYWAGLSGNLTIECDGTNYTVSGDTRTRDYYYYNKNDGTYTLVDRDDEVDISYFASKWYLQAIENLGAPDYLGIKKD